MGIQRLREERGAHAKAVRTLLDNHPGDKWGSEQQAEYDRLVAAIDRVDGEIERRQKVMDLEAEQKLSEQAIEAQARGERDGCPDAKYRQLFTNWLKGGDSALRPEEHAFVAQRSREIRAALGTTPGEAGGYLVPTEFGGRLIEAMKAYGGMREVANVVSTAGGNTIEWPTTDATSEEGEIVGENVEVTDQDPSFGIKRIGAYKYSSKGVAVPFELIQDSGIDIEGHIMQRLATRIARITNRHFTVGTGTNQPEGVVTASALGKTAAAQNALSWEDLLDLEHSVDPAYRASGTCRFMFHDTTLLALKKLKDGEDRPIWLPGVAEREPDRIAGYAYTINQNMPVLAAGEKPVLFGDFSHYMIRDCMSLLLFRFTDSAYSRKGQVGFLAFSRHDGKLLDVGGAIKHLQMAA